MKKLFNWVLYIISFIYLLIGVETELVKYEIHDQNLFIDKNFLKRLLKSYREDIIYSLEQLNCKLYRISYYIKAVFFCIFYLIKNKGHFEIDMQEDSFDENYFVDRDNEDNYIKTSLIDLITDIYECNK